MSESVKVASLLHFKFFRICVWIKFLLRLPYHILFHSFDEMYDGYRGYTVKGFIICNCGFVEDLGVYYGMHCEPCYNRMIQVYKRRIDN